MVNAAQLKEQKLLFATKDAMIKIVPGGEFETNNRTVAATKLQENDMLLSVQPADGMREAVIQTTSGIFLRFPIEEISEMKKNAKGVRGIKLGPVSYTHLSARKDAWKNVSVSESFCHWLKTAESR